MIQDYMQGFELREKVSELSESEKIQVGKELALFLTELHKIESNGNKNEEIDINLKKFDKSVNLLNDYLPEENIEQLKTIKSDYKNLMESKTFCITHGDLNAGNIMITEDNKLSGLIDFGNMEYYIPDVEFIHMYFFDKTIYNAMVKNYDKEIKEQEIVLLELVTNIRHFKNIKNFEDKRNSCLKNIQNYTKQYLTMVKNEKETCRKK